MSSRLLIGNCMMLPGSSLPGPVDILVEDGRIAAIGRAGRARDGLETLDADGRLAVPGFIDLHVHGAGGADILDGTTDALRTISATLARYGTTSFLATTIANEKGGNRHLTTAGESVGAALGGAELLGLHLEGPFVSFKRRGGIPLSAIRAPAMKDLEELIGETTGHLRMMTIAPELPGSLDIIRDLSGRGIIASFGHSDATYEETKRGIDAGIRHVTHMLNGMPPMHHRTPGPVPAILDNDRVTLQIICDGQHLHPAIVRLLWRLAGPGRCVCISDGVGATGLPPGRYLHDGKEYESRGGTARRADGMLIGSVLSVWEIALRLKEFTACSLSEAVGSVTLLPARILGIESRKGSLAPGIEADIVLLNQDLSIHATIIGGRIVHQRTENSQSISPSPEAKRTWTG